MLDIKYIRENAEGIKEAIKNKNIDLDLDNLLEVDEKRVKALKEIEELKAEKNKLNEHMKSVRDDAERKELITQGTKVKEKLAAAEPAYEEIKKEYDGLMVSVPVIPSDDTPVGKDDSENVEVYKRGEIRKFDFTPKTHIELAENLDIIDFEKGSKVSGYRGYYLKNEGTLLVMAMMMYAINKMVEKGYTPIIPPTLIKGFALFGSGYFKGTDYDSATDNIYQIATRDKEMDGAESKEKKFLVGTAEPSLLAYFSDEVLDEAKLPIKVCGFSPCYRSEIGDYGKDNKGLYRVHEFMKVEQVVVSEASIEASTALQEEMIGISEEMHQELGLPYRKLQICTGDMPAGKYRAFDLEAWMPGLNRWGETGSASNFLDWQARRLNVKYKTADGEKKFAYLLNNTALPTVRPLIAILENYQQADGSVVIPEVLRKWMPGGMDKIAKRN
ncbi:MAG: serine--tRNA ligase [Candidatus Pacebacteria bacterium]|nr:serine--tRNA ligase [Candidatus Paceibacterota bacterium]MDR3583544.1 serine--tRNA ligase [Candidatus Paceibacterota bacterium]